MLATADKTAPDEGKRQKLNAHLWVRHPDDWYVEDQETSDLLFAAEKLPQLTTVLDPACGYGRVLRAAKIAGCHALGSDIKPRWKSQKAAITDNHVEGSPCAILEVADFINGPWPPKRTPGWEFPDVIASNPPFMFCDGDVPLFVDLACQRATNKVMMLLPTVWANAGDRQPWLRARGLYREYKIGPRPSMPPGPVIEAGIDPGGGKKDFSWFVFLRGFTGDPTIHFLRRNVR